MIAFNNVSQVPGWFCERGPDYDVAISSRVRLSRNLANHFYPELLKNDEDSEVQSDILSAFGGGNESEPYSSSLVGDLKPIERRLLLERNYISRDFSLQNQKACILSKDHHVSAMVNEIDHLRLASMRGGRSIDSCFEEVDRVDTSLESSLDFAVSLEWGYLNADITNSGTGMKCSVMLHLPALVEVGLIDNALKAVVQMGMSAKGFFGEEDGSLGDMYQIGNQLTFGHSEKELIEKLDAITLQLIHYERKARNEMLERNRIGLEDKILRALGTLRFCKLLPAREAVEHLSSIRLGAALGIIEAPLERITALLFVTQKAHVQQSIDESADANHIDQTRANIVRDALIEGNVNWEDLHV